MSVLSEEYKNYQVAFRFYKCLHTQNFQECKYLDNFDTISVPLYKTNKRKFKKEIVDVIVAHVNNSPHSKNICVTIFETDNKLVGIVVSSKLFKEPTNAIPIEYSSFLRPSKDIPICTEQILNEMKSEIL